MDTDPAQLIAFMRPGRLDLHETTVKVITGPGR